MQQKYLRRDFFLNSPLDRDKNYLIVIKICKSVVNMWYYYITHRDIFNQTKNGDPPRAIRSTSRNNRVSRTETSANFLRKNLVLIRVSGPPERTLMREQRRKGERWIGDENELSEWTQSAPEWREVSNFDKSEAYVSPSVHAFVLRFGITNVIKLMRL